LQGNVTHLDAVTLTHLDKIQLLAVHFCGQAPAHLRYSGEFRVFSGVVHKLVPRPIHTFTHKRTKPRSSNATHLTSRVGRTTSSNRSLAHRSTKYVESWKLESGSVCGGGGGVVIEYDGGPPLAPTLGADGDAIAARVCLRVCIRVCGFDFEFVYGCMCWSDFGYDSGCAGLTPGL